MVIRQFRSLLAEQHCFACWTLPCLQTCNRIKSNTQNMVWQYCLDAHGVALFAMLQNELDNNNVTWCRIERNKLNEKIMILHYFLVEFCSYPQPLPMIPLQFVCKLWRTFARCILLAALRVWFCLQKIRVGCLYL